MSKLQDFSAGALQTEDSLIGLIGGVAGLAGLLVLGLYLLAVIGMWRIFKKAGKAGWLSLIPLVNIYILYKIAWKGGAFWKVFLLGLAAGVLEAAAKDAAEGGMAATVLLLLSLAAGIWAVIVELKMNLRLAKSFSYGALVGLIIFFLPYIGTLVLGFGNNRYVGPIRGRKAG